MDLGLHGKHAVITGGSHGIGLAIAQGLAEEGCNVAICARGMEGLEAAAIALNAKGVDVIAESADVLIDAEIERFVESLAKRWGGIDILINNVGGGGRWGTDNVEETPLEVWYDVMQKNAMAAARFTRLVIPFMRRRKWGRVVTIASIHGLEGGGRPWFNMAKSAEVSMMKTMAMTPYLARDSITFNTVAPGAIMIPDTDWEVQRDSDREAFARMVDRDFPLGRLGTPEEVAAVVVFLCSEQARLINGAAIAVDGGQSRRY